MPKNSRVGRCYDKLVGSGKSKGSAAAICQSSTGQALATGKAPKHPGSRVQQRGARAPGYLTRGR